MLKKLILCDLFYIRKLFYYEVNFIFRTDNSKLHRSLKNVNNLTTWNLLEVICTNNMKLARGHLYKWNYNLSGWKKFSELKRTAFVNVFNVSKWFFTTCKSSATTLFKHKYKYEICICRKTYTHSKNEKATEIMFLQM